MNSVHVKTSLVVMAAGIGSRFGGGVKQLTPVGPAGELIIDYSVYDAVKAGFDKVVFIIRKDIEDDFRVLIGDRLQERLDCEICYVFQELEDLPDGFSVPEGRVKPWGTGQAVLACRDVVQEPFAVINADDYYGKEAFVKVHDYLVAHGGCQHDYCMAGFVLQNTLSDNGGVTRGICKVDSAGRLIGVEETKNIMKAADGRVMSAGKEISVDSYVSMNMWGFSPDFIRILRDAFALFLEDASTDPFKSEFLLPIIVDGLIQEGKASVALLETQDKWFGLTYAEDKPAVVEAFAGLVKAGVYPSPLFDVGESYISTAKRGRD